MEVYCCYVFRPDFKDEWELVCLHPNPSLIHMHACHDVGNLGGYLYLLAWGVRFWCGDGGVIIFFLIQWGGGGVIMFLII